MCCAVTGLPGGRLHAYPSDPREEPEYTLIFIHITLQSAKDAARAYAIDSEDLPGGG